MRPIKVGSASDEDRRLAESLFAVQDRALSAVAPGVPASVPDDLIGAMASLPLSDGKQPSRGGIDALQDALWARGIEVPVVLWPAWPRRLLRVSVHLYNRHAQYEQLAAALREALAVE